MRCGACGHDNPVGVRFCTSCGAAMADAAAGRADASCRRCGASLAPGLRFCTTCGARVEVAASAQARAGQPADAPSASPARYVLAGRTAPDPAGGTTDGPVAPPRTGGRAEHGLLGDPAERVGGLPPTGAIPLTVDELKRFDWRKQWPITAAAGLMLFWVLLTGNIFAPLFAFGIAWFFRRYDDKLDRWLAPIWPIRDNIPRSSRTMLAWIVPLLLSIAIALSPTLYMLFNWLPIVGPDTSVFAFTTLLCALVAFVLLRERQPGMA